MSRTRRFFIPVVLAAFVGGTITASALSGAGASGSGTPHLTPHRLPASSSGGVTPASAGCAVHLVGGAAPAQNHDACISGHGNLNGFSWGDASMGGPYTYLDNEGYCIVRDYDATPVHYYDAGSAGEAGFGVATASMGSPKTYTVTRTTLDGILTVTQNFFLKPATSQLFVGVIVKNNDSVSHQVGVERYFHPNIGGDVTLAWQPSGDFMATSADGGGLGIQLAALSRNVFASGGSINAAGGRIDTPTFLSTAKSGCGSTSFFSAASFGDNYGGVFAYDGFSVTPTIGAGSSQTFQFAYRIY